MASALLPALQLLFLAAVLPSTFATSTWSTCDAKAYPVTVKDVSVDPDPVVSGSEANFLIPAATDREITGGTLVITVYFHNIPVHSERDDLCSKTACPIKPGEFVLQNSQVLPGITPPGSYKIKLQVLDESGDLLTCAYVNFQIVWDWLGDDSHANKSGLSSIVLHNALEKPTTLADK